MQFYLRQFLNTQEHEGIALVEANVREVQKHTHNDEKSVDASFTLGDCGRQISLDFSVYRPEDMENCKQKLRRLRVAIQRFEKALLDAYEEIEK